MLADDLAEMRAEVATDDLRGALARTLRKLDKANASKEELVAAVYRAAKDAAAAVSVPPVPKPDRDRRKADPETAICLLADWQLGKSTPEYDSEVAANRLRAYASKVVDLIALQRSHHPVREARVYLLGDLVEGELIFPGQCVDEATEALTPDGWKRLSDLDGLPIAAYDADAESFRFEVPSALNVYNHDGPMVWHRSRSVDHLATPQHRMLIRTRKEHPWKEFRAADVKPSRWVRTAVPEWAGEWVAPPVEPSDKCPGWAWTCDTADLAALIGWIVSEGSVGYGEVAIWQSRQANEAKWSELHDLLMRVVPTMPGQASRPVTFSANADGFYIYSVPFAAWVTKHFKRSARDVRLPAWVKGWPKRELLALMDALLKGDGHHWPSASPRYTSTSDRLLDDVQEVCLRLGWSSRLGERITTPYSIRGGHGVGSRRVLSIITRPDRVVTTVGQVAYRGRVWCPTVSTGWWLMRRNGKVMVTGNSHRIDASLYRQLFDGAALLAEVVRTIASAVERVRVVGVIGNHGALGGPVRREMHPESNADAMLYNIARLSTHDPRIEWPETLVAGERAWVATDTVLGRTWLLFHGDQVKGGSFGLPYYGFQKRLLGWYTSKGAYDYAASGHWHVPSRLVFNTVTHWGSGSPESANTYAQEYLASGGQRPSQWLLFQGEKGITSEWLVRL